MTKLQCKYLLDRVKRIDGDNLYEAIDEFKIVLSNIIEHLKEKAPAHVDDE